MSQDTPPTDAGAPALATVNDKPDHVYLVSYPKIVYLYPTVLTALFCGIFMWAKGGIPQEEIRVGAVRTNAAAEIREPVTFARAALGAQKDEAAAPSAGKDSTEPEFTFEPATTSEPAATDSAGQTATASPADSPDVKDAAPAANAEETKHTYHNVCARIFLLVIALNLVVIAFDFPRTTSLTWFFAIVAMVIGIWFILKLNPWLAPKIVDALLKIKPAANASFYLIFAGLMLFLYICVLVSRRFDFWEVKGNELLHHHGFLSNLERFSAPNLRIDKEINDVFEYLLLRSGRLIIHASNERRAIVLENVLFINDKEERITKMLGALQVRVRTDRE
ncbi:MAG: hypothetical protein H7Z17_16030 [Fuerstia sp.]|nr:hypothetical protein [Fuerstiella sp.]